MKTCKRTILTCALAILVALLGGASRAQTIAPTDYIMPAGVDPVFLDFTFDGEQYTVSGLDLLPSTFSGGGDGRSFRVPHSNNSGIEFFKFRITSDYAGGFSVDVSSAPGWVVTSVPLGGVDVTAGSGAALVGQPVGPDRYFATFVAGSDSFIGVDDFARSTFVITGYAVPEPGAATLAGCLLSLAGAVAVRGRVRRR